MCRSVYAKKCRRRYQDIIIKKNYSYAIRVSPETCAYIYVCEFVYMYVYVTVCVHMCMYVCAYV